MVSFKEDPNVARAAGRKGGINKRKYDIKIICNKCGQDVTKEGIVPHYKLAHPEIYNRY